MGYKYLIRGIFYGGAMSEKKKSTKKKKDEMVEVTIHDKSESLNSTVNFGDLEQHAIDDLPEPNPVLIPKERLSRLVAETNNFRIVEKFDEDTSKPYFEVVNRRTDDTQKFNTLSDASTFINSQGLR